MPVAATLWSASFAAASKGRSQAHDPDESDPDGGPSTRRGRSPGSDSEGDGSEGDDAGHPSARGPGRQEEGSGDGKDFGNKMRERMLEKRKAMGDAPKPRWVMPL